MSTSSGRLLLAFNQYDDMSYSNRFVLNNDEIRKLSFLDGRAGGGNVWAGDYDAFMKFNFSTNTTVNSIDGLNSSIIQSTSNSLNVYGDGNDIFIENKLGDTKTVFFDINFYVP